MHGAPSPQAAFNPGWQADIDAQLARATANATVAVDIAMEAAFGHDHARIVSTLDAALASPRSHAPIVRIALGATREARLHLLRKGAAEA